VESRGARLAASRDGAYLLRTNLESSDPAELWSQYIQLTEVEAAFASPQKRTGHPPDLASHPASRRGHTSVAFLGYLQKLKVVADSITPARALQSLRSILIVEVWFNLRDGGQVCLLRITEPEKEQASCSIT
jgi:hypothetical protein